MTNRISNKTYVKHVDELKHLSVNNCYMELSLKTLSESEYLGTQQHNACSQIFSHQHREEEKNFFNLRVENWFN